MRPENDLSSGMTSISHIEERALPAPLSPLRLGRRPRFWQAIMNRLIPLGYEDETGFHYGMPEVVPVLLPGKHQGH